MLSVKTATNLCNMANSGHHGSSSSNYHRRSSYTGSSSSMMEQDYNSTGSYSSTSTSSSSDNSSCSNHHQDAPPTLGLKKTHTMSSSYALTSLLLEQQQQQHACDLEEDRPRLEACTSLAMALAADPASVVAMAASSSSTSSSSDSIMMTPLEFGATLQSATTRHHHDKNNQEETLDPHQLRRVLEGPLRQARKRRDACRSNSTFTPLTSWMDLPYSSLREERPFLYDHMHTHPLADILRQTICSNDLHDLHVGWDRQRQTAVEHQRQWLAPLLDRQARQAFQQAYESFVTSCCIPLLHAAALRTNVFPAGPAGVVYRYQVFPTINIVYPNDPQACRPPSCDLIQGHSVAWLHFHVPLTASVGTSALYCERYPGKEDWHPLRCTSVGLGYCWDGARCLSFVPLNTTSRTRVSLDFRILLTSTTANHSKNILTAPISTRRGSTNTTGTSNDHDANNTTTTNLCQPHHLEQDSLTMTPGFYEEATMDHAFVGASRILLRRRSSSSSQSSSTNNNNNDSVSFSRLVEPDARCGFPFA